MPISDELAALRARGTVKATSTALSSKASEPFTTPQQQEALRKAFSKRELAARKDAKMYLTKHNAGGLDDIWLRKLRELRARKKRAGGAVGWKKKEANDDGSTELEEEEDDGLEVEMLPEQLVKELKAKYETENAKEALDRALKDEKEGKATILSDAMRLDEEEEDDEKKSEEEDGAADEKKSEEEDGTAEEKVEDVKEPAGNAINVEPEENVSEAEIVNSVEQSEQSHHAGTIIPPPPTNDESADDNDDKEQVAVEETVKEDPVEEVRSEIEQLSIENDESKPVEEQEEAEGDSSNQVNEEQSGDDAAIVTEEVTDENKIPDDTADKQSKLLYNTQHKQLISISNGEIQSDIFLQYLNQQSQVDANEATDSTTASDSNEEYIDLADPQQREKLDEEQKAQAKERILAMQEQLQKIIAEW